MNSDDAPIKRKFNMNNMLAIVDMTKATPTDIITFLLNEDLDFFLKYEAPIN